jgi:hypothetical protein
MLHMDKFSFQQYRPYTGKILISSARLRSKYHSLGRGLLVINKSILKLDSKKQDCFQTGIFAIYNRDCG